MADNSSDTTIATRPEGFFAGFQVANPLHRAELPDFFERHYQRHVLAAKNEFARFNDCHGPIKLKLAQIKHPNFSEPCFGVQVDYQEGAESSWLDYVDDELPYDTDLLANKRDACGNLLKPDEEFRINSEILGWSRYQCHIQLIEHSDVVDDLRRLNVSWSYEQDGERALLIVPNLASAMLLKLRYG